MSPDDPRHGTNIGYNAGCRDQCCRHAHMVWMKRYRLYGGVSTVSARGFNRRVRALQAIGYTTRTLSAEMGRSKSFVDATIGQERVRRVTHEAMADIYERLCMTPPQGWVADRARRRAAEAGYASPLAWDDIDRDDQPQTGQARSHGRTLENYRWLREAGESHEVAAARVGVSPESIEAALQREKRAA